MDVITLASEHPDIQALIYRYNQAIRNEDSGGNLQTIADEADELVANSGLDTDRTAELSMVFAMCQLAMAELNLSTAQSYIELDSQLGRFVRRQLHRLI
jgi:hypothetical protein